ncbi:EamA family transporter [Winogradskyella psychrotolerans]|uniref:EamA family transporter n=1 Tax=Winogradskyella psychrotolerans TaxID=1344585 RepID=UPI001C070F00|nr:EamA family transporter [Winogradskyella psychrotolerans]MBU2921053.1 EamA family transporter [Winogradskyella psychrotolerans]
MPKPSSKSLIIIAFIAIYIIWGSTYLLNKISVTELPPLFLAAVRFSVASILIFGIAKVLKFSLKITKKQFLNSALVGFLFLVYGNGVFVWALKYVDSGFGALLAATQPLFVLLLMRLIDHKKMRPKSLIGVGLGILGMYLLVSQKELVTNEETLLGIFMIFTCVLSWSYGSVYVAKADVPKNYFVSTGYQMGIASIMLACGSLTLGEDWTSPLVWSPKVQLAMLALITFGSIAAFTAFNYLLKQVSTEKVATSAYINPIVAMILGWYVLDETLSTQSIIAAVVLLTGVYFITTRKKDIV